MKKINRFNMNTFTVMTYNIENMSSMFKKNKLDESRKARFDAVSKTIKSINPDILGIVEASNKVENHQQFIEKYNMDYKIASSQYKRGKQDLIFYYKDKFEVVSIDANYNYYDQWIEDIDNDSIKEVCEFERYPLEVKFKEKQTGKVFLIILLLLKSKGVFSVTELQAYQNFALANRKKLHAQAKKVRERIDYLMINEPDLPVIVMGDYNDSPGLDFYQKIIGESAVETIMGSVFFPERILHNTLYHIKENNPSKAWTTEFTNPTLNTSKMHRSWIDHLCITPNFFDIDSPIKYVLNSGAIAEKTDAAKCASDHYPIYCKFSINSN
jgi:endonuclease/exonuclease/phosphatase family metal-dependent hydrolase